MLKLQSKLEQKIKTSQEQEQASSQRIFLLQEERQKLRANLESQLKELSSQRLQYEEKVAELEAQINDPEHDLRKEKIALQEEEIERLESELEIMQNALEKNLALCKQQEQYFEREKSNLKQHVKDVEQQYSLMVKKMKEKLIREKEQNDPLLKKALI